MIGLRKMPQLVRELKIMGIQSGWIDGEIVVFKSRRRAGAQRTENSMDQSTSTDIVYFVFGVPFYEGYDLLPSP
jgi:bifunctional non-homologous end joining protein LigD